MPGKKIYTIGEVSKLCNITPKALRIYDELGLIHSLRHENNYRVYTQEALLTVPVIKYYKQMGFKLQEMKHFLLEKGSDVFRDFRIAFDSKTEELIAQRETLRRCEVSIKEWMSLLMEAESVIAAGVNEVSIKYIASQKLLFCEQRFNGDIRSALINVQFMDYVEKSGNAIAGPVFLAFHDLESRMKCAENQSMLVMQKAIGHDTLEKQMEIGGCMAASCYHTGPLEQIPETYAKMAAWIGRHGYIAEGSSWERFVSDYWTTQNSNFHVAEILIPVARKTK